MSGIGFQNDPRGWWFFTVLLSDTVNPTWPISVAGVPIGQGGSVSQAGAPSGFLTPPGRKLILRGVFALQAGGAGAQGVILRHGDGTTPYFDGATVGISSATNPICGLGVGALAIPLYNGLTAISPVSGAFRVLVCYEPTDN
jgi:hypothetical protein